MIDYSLKNGHVHAGLPVEVGHNSGHFWFPSLHTVGENTLVCAVIRSADVAQGKWPAELFISEDSSASWRFDQAIESYGHASVVQEGEGTLMMPYELWPFGPDDRVNGSAPGTVLTRTKPGSLAAENREICFCGFPAPLAIYHENELWLHHNGNIVSLPGGQRFTTLYGRFEGDSHYCCFAAVSDDDGVTWTYRGTVANGSAVPGAPEGPNESSTQLLDNGDLLCVYRVSGEWDFRKSYSSDAGKTWSQPILMQGMWSVQPRLIRLPNGALFLTGGRPGLFCWLCTDGHGDAWDRINLGKHHNECVAGATKRFSDAFCNAEKGEDVALSTSYTGITVWGQDQVIVTYDRLANGWSGAPGANGEVDRVFSLVLTLVI